MNNLKQANIEVLQQLQSLIRGCIPIYSHCGSQQQSSVGRHVRHILDHFRAVQEGLPLNRVDYNQRSRDCIEETDPNSALATTDTLIHWLETSLIDDQQLEVVSEISVGHFESQCLPSQLSRELLYLINHTIHHMAYAALLARTQNVDLPANIGIAPSTASYQRTQH